MPLDFFKQAIPNTMTIQLNVTNYHYLVTYSYNDTHILITVIFRTEPINAVHFLV
jgi:hypothetical protein